MSSHSILPTDRLLDYLPTYKSNVYRTAQLSAADQETLRSELSDRHVLYTRPYEDGPGVEYADEVIEAFHKKVESPSFLGKLIGDDTGEVPEFSYEIWFDDNKLKFIWTLPDDYWYNEFRRVITGEYPRVGVGRTGKQIPSFRATDHIAGGKLEFDNNKFIPIKRTNGVGSFDEDKAPLRLITSEIAGQQGTSAMMQVVFRPAPPDWRRGKGFHVRDADTVAKHYREENFHDSLLNPTLEDPTEKDRRIARVISDHSGQPAFYVTMRFFVFAPKPGTAQNYAASIANAYRATYHTKAVNQQLVGESFTPSEIPEQLEDALHRNWDGEQRPVTVSELAGIAHIPNGDVDTQNIHWTRDALTSRVPSEAPRKPATIDALPYDYYGERHSEDALTVTAPQLPSGGKTGVEAAEGDDDQQPIATDAETAGVSTSSTNDNSGDGRFDKSYARDRSPGESIYGQPQRRVSERNRDEFSSVVTGVQRGEYTYDDIRERMDNENEAENLISLIKKEIKWREKNPGPDIPQESGDADIEMKSGRTKGQQSTGGGTAPQQWSDHYEAGPQSANLPAKPGDYEEYAFQPAEFHREWMYDPHTKEDRAYELKVRRERPGNQDDEWYMGRDVKNELIDIHEDHPESPIWLGWMKDNRVGVHEIGVDKSQWFRHFSAFGTTGSGKSTWEKNILNQIARKGYGFCYIDPKADAVYDLLYELPEDRLDDIIWIRPGSVDHDRVVGINFLETSFDNDHPRYNREVASIVDDLTSILKGGDYWGPKMEGITTNISRAMIRSDINYTLLDMYYVLQSPEARRAFAEIVKQEGKKKRRHGVDDEYVEDMENISTYTEQIAQMDYEEVDAVVRRIQHWIEDPIARAIVAHREGTVNISEAVEDGKIILVCIDIDSQDIKEVVTTAVMRRIWATIKARKEEEHEREPFFSFIDEFDDVVTPEMDIEKMLSKARSGKMGVGLANQNPSQVPDAPRKQMFSNVRTLSTFSVPEPEDAGLLAARFGEDVDRHDIEHIPQFTVYTRISMQTDDGPQVSPPLALNTFADYPPLRDEDEIHEVIQNSLDKYGVEPLEGTHEEARMILFDMGNSVTVRKAFLQAIWEAQIHRETEYVALTGVNEHFEPRTNRALTDYPEGVSLHPDWCDVYQLANDRADPEEIAERIAEDDPANNPIDAAADETLRRRGYTPVQPNSAGDIMVNELDGVARISEAGKEQIMAADNTRVPPSTTHRKILAQGGFEWLTRAGLRVNILEQLNDHSAPDAEGILPVESSPDSLAEAREAWDALEADYELLDQLTKGKEVAIEAEASLNKPAGPLQNVARATTNNRRTIFFVPDGRPEDRLPDRVTPDVTHWAQRLHNILYAPRFAREHNVWEDNDDTVRTSLYLYNTQDVLSLADDGGSRKFPLIDKGSECTWEKRDTDTLILYDGRGEGAKQRGRIAADKIDDATVNSFDNWCRYDEYEEEWVVYPDQAPEQTYQTLEALEERWQKVYRPFLPEMDISGDPETIDPLIVIVPDEAYIQSPDGAVPAVYRPHDGPQLTPDAPENAPGTPHTSETTEDGAPITEPLIPQQYRGDWNPKSYPGYTPIEDTPDYLEGNANDPLDKQLEDVLEPRTIMTENIDTCPDIGSTTIPDKDYDPYHDPDYNFKGKDPTSRDLWKQVWDHHDENLEQGLSKPKLKDGLVEGVAVPSADHAAAIKAGVKTGHLIPSEDAGFFLARPHQRPELFLEVPEQYADREVWAEIWEETGRDPTETIPRRPLRYGALGFGPFTGDKADRQLISAAIEIALRRGGLAITDGDKIGLPEPTIPDIWETVWREIGADLDDGCDQHLVRTVLGGITFEREEAMSRSEADEQAANDVDEAISTGILEDRDGELHIGDPTKRSPAPTDGDDDGDDSTDEDEEGGNTSDDGSNDSGGGETPDDVGSKGEQSSSPESGGETSNESSDLKESGSDSDQEGQSPNNADSTASSGAADEGAAPDADGHKDSQTQQTTFELSGDERLDITPTDSAPSGWKDAFEAAIEAYATQATNTIDEHVNWNSCLNNHHSLCYTEAAACTDHDTYAPNCRYCRPRFTCQRCGQHDAPLGRMIWVNCQDEHDTSVDGSCNDCGGKAICYNCVHGTDSKDTATAPFSDPVEIVERVTCWSCDEFQQHDTDDTTTRCYCQETFVTEPVQYLPETAHEYYTGPDWDALDTDDQDLLASHDSHAVYEEKRANMVGRGWDTEVVKQRQLGWAPDKRWDKPVLVALHEEGYTVQQLLATGLFTFDISSLRKLYDIDEELWESLAELPLQSHLESPDHELTIKTLLKPRWLGRLVFPVYDTNGDPVFVYGRKMKQRSIFSDFQNGKYLKLPSKAYIWAHEPIYGSDVIDEFKADVAVITEGVADAIAALHYDLPVLSPATTQFKEEHHEPLATLLADNDYEGALIINDAEPASFDPLPETAYDLEAIEDELDYREDLYDGATITGEANTDMDTDTDTDADGLDALRDRIERQNGPGPIGKALEVEEVTPGLYGAIVTAEALAEFDLPTGQVQLPRFAHDKVDLDDYLTSSLVEYAPPFPSVRALDAPHLSSTEATCSQGLITALWQSQLYVEYIQDERIEAWDELPETLMRRLEESPWEVREHVRDKYLHSRNGGPDGTEQAEMLQTAAREDSPHRLADLPLGRYLSLGNIVPAPELVDAPRTPTYGVPVNADFANEAVGLEPCQAANEYPGGTAGDKRPQNDVDGADSVSLDEEADRAFNATDTGFLQTVTPLFDGPVIHQAEHHPNYRDISHQKVTNKLQDDDSTDYAPEASASDDRGNVRYRNQFFQLSLSVITGMDEKDRGPNPLGHIGESRDYFVMLSNEVAFDHKRKATYTAPTFLAVEATGTTRQARNPGPHKVTKWPDDELLHTWVHTKATYAVLGASARVPRRAFRAAAIELDIVGEDDLVTKEIGTSNGTVELSDALPTWAYNETVDQFEDKYGVDPGRSKIPSKELFIVDDVTTDSSVETFVDIYLTTDPPEARVDYVEPREPVADVWETYQSWCELNGISPKSEYRGAKSEIAEVLDVEKTATHWGYSDAERTQCYIGAKFSSNGWWYFNTVLKED